MRSFAGTVKADEIPAELSGISFESTTRILTLSCTMLSGITKGPPVAASAELKMPSFGVTPSELIRVEEVKLFVDQYKFTFWIL